MFYYYFTFRTMTAAQQAALTLLRFSIDAELVRVPRHLSQMGCSYAVRTGQTDAYRAGIILSQEGLAYVRGIPSDYWMVDENDIF